MNQKTRHVGADALKSAQQKGITLIALVITIIVLLILAGVTISMVLGDEGIIAQAQQAKEKQEEKAKDEQEELDKYAGNVDKYTEGTAAWYAEKGELKVGDYVEYTYDAPEDGYTALASKTGADVDQTFESAEGKTAEITAWRVLSTTEGVITLVSETGTEKNLKIDGAKGYINGPDLLNEMCKTLYSSENGTARSINGKDITKILEKYSDKAVEDAEPAYRYADINGALVEFEYGMTIGDAEKEEGKTLTNIKTPDGSNYKNLKMTYYNSSFSNLVVNSKNEENEYEHPELEILYPVTGNYSTDHWVATAMCYPNFKDDLIRYCMGLNYGRKYYGKALYYSNGDNTSKKDADADGNLVYTDHPVRPVVQLKAGTKVEWVEADNKWSIIEN